MFASVLYFLENYFCFFIFLQKHNKPNKATIAVSGNKFEYELPYLAIIAVNGKNFHVCLASEPDC